ncbi:hypothetical protein [Asticcacaulis sp.]|uniref:hypothetical protein n=1 Tax=Asticcacaulis sp. TaxID=1872648 RepID=UPI002D1184BB|nr:hypothetical protein [Asticcacaulis sp.]HTM81922.1 hypothetical protein [Asticcacaulis sp.]
MNTFAEFGLRSPPHTVYNERENVTFEVGAILIYGQAEYRSQLPARWSAQFDSDRIFEISEGDEFGQIKVDLLPGQTFSFRDNGPLRQWVEDLVGTVIYLDITGLGHHLWMPLLRLLIEGEKDVQCLYTEPGVYTPSLHPKPGDFFDLSERTIGFKPVPTFARIPRRGSAPNLLIPLLGYEGARFKHLIETFEPSDRDIYPIVGVPGFEIDYPFHAFEGNAGPLSSTRAWQRVDYVDAACPFSVYSYIERARNEWPGRAIQVATIGTKPHALGAMLYALRDNSCDLLYDHPVRKAGRTGGSGKCHRYDVSTFWRLGH